MNIACLLDDGTLVVPPFENALNGITVQRMMELVPQARGAVALVPYWGTRPRWAPSPPPTPLTAPPPADAPPPPACLPQAIADGLEGVQRVEQRHISVLEAKQRSREVMLVGSSLPVMPVVQWDDVLIADGTPGLAALQLRVVLQTDMEPRANSGQHVGVPYGYLTGYGL